MPKLRLKPNPTHPITVEPAGVRVRVFAGDTEVADTTKALALEESTYPVVYYVPMADVDRDLLRRSTTMTYCPFKGDAVHYDVVTGEGEIADGAWEYQQPYDAVAPIQGHVAFYRAKVTITAD